MSILPLIINKTAAGGGGGGAVDSVNGQTGAVVLDAGDIAEVANRNYVSDAEAAALAASNSPSGANPFATMADVGGGGGVSEDFVIAMAVAL